MNADMAADAVPSEREPSEREFVMLLTPESQLRQRIGTSALGHYFEAVRREVSAFFLQHPLSRGLDLQVAIAIFPDRSPLIDLQGQPWLPPPTELLLVSRLEAVEVPAVWNGPAAFSFRQMIGGGWSEGEPQFPFPFVRLCEPLTNGEPVDAFLERCATQQEQSKFDSWTKPLHGVITGILKWLPTKWAENISRFWKPKPTVASTSDLLPPLPAESEEDIFVPDLAPMPLDQIDQQIAMFPNEVWHYYRRIQAHIERDDQVQVTRDCREALRLEPDHPWTLLALVCSLRAQDDSAGALAILTGMIQKHPKIVEGYVQRAEIYAEIGAYDAMFADLEQALRVSPRSPRLLMRHAHCCSALGRIDDAYRDLAILQRLDPHDSRIFALRAYIRRRSSGNPDTEEENRTLALADAERALKVDPNCATAYGIRAEIQISVGHFTEAIDDCKRALECDPHYIDALAFRGLARYRQGQIADAATDLKTALERGCLLHFVRSLLAEVQHLQGDHDAALAMLDTVLEQSPDDVQVLLHKSVLLLNSDRPQEALELLNQIVKTSPDLAVAYAERGKARRAVQELTDALDDFTAALRLGVNDPLVRLNRALTLMELERFDEALDEFTVGLSESPGSALGHFYRGCTYFSLQQFDAALADFNTSIELDPEFPDAYFRRALTSMSRQQFAAAIADFTILIERFPQPAAYAYRGQARILAGLLQQADQDFQEAIQLAPGDTENFRIMQLLSESQYHHQREDYDESIERATEALAMDDQAISGWLQRAASRWYGNQFVEAVEDYTQALDIMGPNASALNGRGQIYAELGEYDLALEDLDQALTLSEENEVELLAYIQNGRGLALTGLQRFDEAAVAFEQSILTRPGNAWAHYNHGLMYLTQGQKPSAVVCFRLALHLTEPALRAGQRARALGFLNRQEASPDRT